MSSLFFCHLASQPSLSEKQISFPPFLCFIPMVYFCGHHLNHLYVFTVVLFSSAHAMRPFTNGQGVKEHQEKTHYLFTFLWKLMLLTSCSTSQQASVSQGQTSLTLIPLQATKSTAQVHRCKQLSSSTGVQHCSRPNRYS